MSGNCSTRLRAAQASTCWLSTTGLEWRKNFRYVATDVSPTYRVAVRTELPGTTVVVDRFTLSITPARCSRRSGAVPPPN
ncbi:transposase [Streptomyces sp. NPDC001635]